MWAFNYNKLVLQESTHDRNGVFTPGVAEGSRDHGHFHTATHTASNVNKDWTTKDQDKDKDQGQTFKDKDWPRLISKD